MVAAAVEGIVASELPTVGTMRATAAVEEEGIATSSSAVGAAVKGRRPDTGVGVC